MCIIEQAARCVYATLPLTLLLVQVEVIVVVACEYSFGYLVDCAIDPFAALLESLVARRAGSTVEDIDSRRLA